MAKVQTKIIDKGWRDIEKTIYKLDGSYTLVGYIASTSSQDVVNKAIWNEFRTSKSPSRPFMRKTYDRRKRQTEKLMDKYALLVMDGRLTIKQALSTMGEIYVGFIKDQIRNGSWAPNAPSTMKMKKSSRPLIDSGEMIGATTHKEFV